jgi:DNA-binding LacI/PurR family transcriptional regulator
MTIAGATVLDISNTHLMQASPDIQMPNEDVLRACIDKFLASSPRPEGLFITADVVAPPLYRELDRRGITPGVDLHVVSCNNERSYLTQLKTQPAVVDIQSGQIGARAVESLFWRLQNPDALRQSILIEPVLHLPRS